MGRDLSLPTSSAPPSQQWAHAEKRRCPLPPDLSGSPRYPWSLIQLDYCAGVIPIDGIVQKYSPLSRERLLTVARREGWRRYQVTADDLYGPKTFGLHPHAPGTLSLPPEDIRRVAIEQAMQVVGVHRKDIARARAMFETLMNRMLLVLGGSLEYARDLETNEIILDSDGEGIPLPAFGGRESPADALNKLTASLVRVIGLERQAYGLDVLGIKDVDSDGSETASVKSELAELEDRLDQIAANKASPTTEAAGVEVLEPDPKDEES